jgi:hypothetical protein
MKQGIIVSLSKINTVNVNNINKMSKFKYFGIKLWHTDDMIITKQVMSSKPVQSYIKNNFLGSYILMTLLNECCRYIMLYHNLLNCYHGNTTIQNFMLYEDNKCLIPIELIGNDNNTLTSKTKYDDYLMLFETFYHELNYKNKHFNEIFLHYNNTFLKNL